MRTKRLGVRDIARLAGVAPATVSRVLNTPAQVRDETRKRVEDVIKSLNYVPDATARALTARETKTIGTIVPTVDNAVYASGISAAQKYLAAKGYTLVLATSDYDLDLEFRQARNLVGRRVDGLILRGSDHLPGLIELLNRQGVPWVGVGSYAPESPFPSVGINNHAAGFRAASHLVELGHRRIGLLAGRTRTNDRARSRAEGVEDALSRNGITIPEVWRFEVDVGLDDARQTAKSLLAQADRPTAVVCTTDVIAFGVIIECARSGVRIPDSLSVIGIGDLEWSRHIQPALTTIAIPTVEVWKRACDFLVQSLAGGKLRRHFEYEFELIVRDTTARMRD